MSTSAEPSGRKPSGRRKGAVRLRRRHRRFHTQGPRASRFRVLDRLTLPYIVAVALALLGMPELFQSPINMRDSLDSSWMTYNVLAVRYHITFGSRFIWTYGPLGFLNIPTAVSRPMLAFTDLSQILFAACTAAIVVWFLGKHLRWPTCWVWGFLVVLLLPARPNGMQTGQLEFLGPILAALLLAAAMGDKPRPAPSRYGLVLIAGVLATTGALIKDTAIPISFLLLACAAVALWLRRNRYESALLVATSACVWILAFTLADGRLSTGVAWLWSILPLITGYSSMANPGPRWLLVAALTCCAGIVGILFLVMNGNRRITSADWLLAVPLFTAFVAFKEAFVRQDIYHVAAFFAVMPWCTLLFAAWSRSHGEPRQTARKARTTLFAIAATCASIAVANWNTVLPTAVELHQRIQLARTAVHVVASRSWSATTLERSATTSYNGLPPLAPQVRGHTAFAWPWDGNAILAAGGIETPPPVPQAYSAYAPELDAADARFLSSPNRPRYALVAPESIDGRLPLQTAPRSLRAIMRCYRPLRTSGMFVFAERGPCRPRTHRTSTPWRTAFMGSWLHIPQSPGTMELAQFRIHPSSSGSLFGLFFRIMPSDIRMRFANGATHPYRLVPATAATGVLASYVPTTPLALFSLWAGHPLPSDRVRRIAVTTATPSEWRRHFQVRFLSVPLP